jgi:hypothetical protein
MATLATSKEFPFFIRRRQQPLARISFDPTTGALIVPPDLDRKICKAIKGVVRYVKLCLRFRREILRFEVFQFEARCMLIKARRDLARFLRNYVFY